MSKKIITVIIFLIGVLLIVMPFAYSMFDRTSSGADLMTAFEPILVQPVVDKFNVHLETISAMQADTEKMIPALAEKLGISGEEMNGMLTQQFPGVANGLQQMDTMKKDLTGVVTVMGQQVENFASANKLPMKATPWFFIIPGAVLVLLSLTLLVLTDSKRVAA